MVTKVPLTPFLRLRLRPPVPVPVIVLLLVLLQLAANVRAAIQPIRLCNESRFIACTLGDNMVLQRDISTSIFGYSAVAAANITVTSSFLKAPLTTLANSIKDAALSGSESFFWKVDLPAMPGSLASYSLTVSSNAGESQVLNNVVFGDVFFCGGQSNMQFTIAGDFDQVSATSESSHYPFIRLFTVGQHATVPQFSGPQRDLSFVAQPWSTASPEAVNPDPKNAFAYFSAICWHFGRNVFDRYLGSKIPVGLLSNNWTGSRIEAWCPAPVVANCNAGNKRYHEGRHDGHHNRNASNRITLVDTIVNEGDTDWHNPQVGDVLSSADNRSRQSEPLLRRNLMAEPIEFNKIAALYNAMIMPYRHMRFKAVLWYQGETNVLQEPVSQHSTYYPCLQDSMVHSWRKLWGQHALPFLYTQLTSWKADSRYKLAEFRLIQASIDSLTPHSAMATAADLGDPQAPPPFYDIHPRRKKEIGRRLSLAAAVLVYGKSIKEVPYTGPLIASIKKVIVKEHDRLQRGYPGRFYFKVVFAPASCGSGIKITADLTCPRTVVVLGWGCAAMEFVYKDGRIADAQVVKMSAYSMEIHPTNSSSTELPERLQYGMANYPLLSIYNSLDVPLLPFSMALRK